MALWWIRQQRLQGAVHDEVRISPDGTGEMAVVGFCQTVVADGFSGIRGTLEALEQAEFDDVFFGRALGII